MLKEKIPNLKKKLSIKLQEIHKHKNHFFDTEKTVSLAYNYETVQHKEYRKCIKALWENGGKRDKANITNIPDFLKLNLNTNKSLERCALNFITP